MSTELILGLPGETAESYKAGIAYCVEHSIVYYVSLLTNLQNSEMNDKQYRELHDIKSIEMVDPSGDSTDDTNDLVVCTLCSYRAGICRFSYLESASYLFILL